MTLIQEAIETTIQEYKRIAEWMRKQEAYLTIDYIQMYVWEEECKSPI